MKETQVKINAKVIESEAHDQIKLMKDSPAFKGLISIMPDVHKGVGSVIGFTGMFNNCVIPNVIGVDIGCGVSAYPLGEIEIDFEALDKYIRENVPLGFKSHNTDDYLKKIHPLLKRDAEGLCSLITSNFYRYTYYKYTNPLLQLGTLGGGNHFIEIGETHNGRKWLIVHSGSRNLGQKVAKWYQGEAKKFHSKLPTQPIKDLEWLPMEYGGEEYIKNMRLAQRYAKLNREIIINIILGYFDRLYDNNLLINSTHNYISPKDDIIRKGAISAHKGERVIIPMNMSVGCIVGFGKGNKSYNYSAPHGAGRVYGRQEMKRKLESGEVTIKQFQESMEGIFTTCIRKRTIDESPMAYKSIEDIREHLEETVEIEEILKPIYNLKG